MKHKCKTCKCEDVGEVSFSYNKKWMALGKYCIYGLGIACGVFMIGRITLLLFGC